MILGADFHLTDDPRNEYRWLVFDSLVRLAEQGEQEFFILGDLCHFKDRHSGELVNRLVFEFDRVYKASGNTCEFHIIMGNHDIPLSGTPFWNVLNSLEIPVNFYTEPAVVNDAILMLPYAANPSEEWAELDLSQYPCVMLHQTVDGAVGESGHPLSNPNMPALNPRSYVYAGDIHLPQEVGNLTYIGAPHPINFGDEWEYRLLKLHSGDGDVKPFSVAREIKLDPPAKTVVHMTMGDGFPSQLRRGDAARFNIEISRFELPEFAAFERTLRETAASSGVRVDRVQVEVAPEATASRASTKVNEENANDSPEKLLEVFAAHEGIDDPDLVDAGVRLLAQAEKEMIRCDR